MKLSVTFLFQRFLSDETLEIYRKYQSFIFRTSFYDLTLVNCRGWLLRRGVKLFFKFKKGVIKNWGAGV